MRKRSEINLIFDFDGVICANNDGNYDNAPAYSHAIKNINRAFELGYYIIIFTARYGLRNPGSQYQWGYIEAVNWLNKNGVKFNELRMGKPAGDLYVDDKACVVQSENGNYDWENNFWPAVEKIIKR